MLSGCARSTPQGPPPAVVPLASIAPGARLRVEVNGRPVELSRDAAGAVTGRSLLCTHQGCEVAWVPEESLYRCPCHEGRFDAEGRVAAGPPTGPLPSVAAVVRGGDVVVGG